MHMVAGYSFDMQRKRVGFGIFFFSKDSSPGPISIDKKMLLGWVWGFLVSIQIKEPMHEGVHLKETIAKVTSQASAIAFPLNCTGKFKTRFKFQKDPILPLVPHSMVYYLVVCLSSPVPSVSK